MELYETDATVFKLDLKVCDYWIWSWTQNIAET